MSEKIYAIWFIDVSHLNQTLANAKCKQISDWATKHKVFGHRDVLLVPSNENKLCMFKTEKEFLEDFNGNSLEWLNEIKDKLEECLTINLFEDKE
jgi:hypothetical protein